jgi:ribosomal protein L24E
MLPRRRVAALIAGALVLGLTAIGIHRVVRTAPLDEGSDEAAAVHAGKQSSKAKRTLNPRQLQKEAGLEGRWRKVPAPLTQQQTEEIQQLEALGYVSGSKPGSGFLGVTQNQTEKAAPGVNFYSSGHGPEAILVDMHGRVLHKWAFSFEQAFPGRKVPKKKVQGIHHWRRAILLEDGGVIAIFEGHGIIRVDKDSNLVWANPTRAHHDAHVLPDGQVYTLTRVAHMVPEVNTKHPVLEDFIIALDGQTGEETLRVSVLTAFQTSEFREIWLSSPKRKGDLMHTNAIEMLDGRLAAVHPAFQAGRVMISMRTLDALAVVDLESAKVVWAHVGSYKKQHDPRSLDSGRILLFDNRGAGETASRILELDPGTGELEVIYGARPGQAFTSAFCGTSMRLGNGNTLVTESDQGRAFEFTPAGEIVWEFYNPARAGENDEFVASLFEVERIELGFVEGWLR